jgi:prepilin-type N-terminal cleavage/methylation domain-containing protein/prepilin-type processing-associated H-X9-DG protein
MQRRHTQCARAFTLVELLVTISIIALLMAILVPIMSKVREQARRIVCSGSDLRQIGQLLELYAADNRGFYPSAYSAWYPNAGCALNMTDPASGLQVEFNAGLITLVPYLYKLSSGPTLHDQLNSTKADLSRMNIFWCPSGANRFDPGDLATPFLGTGFNQYCGQWGYASGTGTPTFENCTERNYAYTVSKSMVVVGGSVQIRTFVVPTKPAWLTFTDICYYGEPAYTKNQGSGKTTEVRSNHPGPHKRVGALNPKTYSTPGGGNSLHVDGHVQWNQGPVLNDNTKSIYLRIQAGSFPANSYWVYPKVQ